MDGDGEGLGGVGWGMDGAGWGGLGVIIAADAEDAAEAGVRTGR